MRNHDFFNNNCTRRINLHFCKKIVLIFEILSDLCYSIKPLFVQRYGLLGMDSFYLMLTITKMLLNQPFLLKTLLLMASENSAGRIAFEWELIMSNQLGNKSRNWAPFTYYKSCNNSYLTKRKVIWINQILCRQYFLHWNWWHYSIILYCFYKFSCLMSKLIYLFNLKSFWKCAFHNFKALIETIFLNFAHV